MKRLILCTVVLALAVTAVAWAKLSIVVSPTTVKAGHTVTVSGSAGKYCSKEQLTLISHAFPSKHEFASVPALFVKTASGGSFSVKTTIPSTRRAGKYTITGRCGGGNLGVSATLKVTR